MSDQWSPRLNADGNYQIPKLSKFDVKAIEKLYGLCLKGVCTLRPFRRKIFFVAYIEIVIFRVFSKRTKR